MRPVLLAVLVTFLGIQGLGQSICALHSSDLPPVHGIRLGTSRDDLTFMFASTANTGPIAKSALPPPDLSHLEEIWTGFFHDRLASVEFDYDRTTEWKNVRQFASHLQSELKLPVESWVFVGETEAVMECSDFKVSISSVRNTLGLTDTFAKAAAQEETRRSTDQSRKRVY